jgi:branched-chain amino acid transport system permease protein
MHFVTCEFSGSRYDKDRLDLAAVQIDAAPLGEARLLYLKRFWLAPGNDIALPAPAVIQIPATAAYAVQQTINAIALAAIYGLLATAYSLIYGLAGRINLAFGEIAVIGAYAAIGGVGVIVTLGLNDPIAGLSVALCVAALICLLWSWFLGRAVIGPLHARHRQGQPILVATAAAAVSIQEFLRLFQGVRERWLPPFFSGPVPLARSGSFVVTVTPMQIGIAISATCAAIALLVLMARTRFGREWRAFADDPVAASMVGVAPQRILAATFVVAGVAAGLAGWIVAIYYGNVSFSMGTMLGLKALLAAIVGGIGRVEGALLGGLLIGLIEAVWSAYFDIASRDLVLFSLLVVMFVLRPGGLLGFSGPSPREV